MCYSDVQCTRPNKNLKSYFALDSGEVDTMTIFLTLTDYNYFTTLSMFQTDETFIYHIVLFQFPTKLDQICNFNNFISVLQNDTVSNKCSYSPGHLAINSRHEPELSSANYHVYIYILRWIELVVYFGICGKQFYNKNLLSRQPIKFIRFNI